MYTPDDILAFWFPSGMDRDEPTHFAQIKWWFRGGADGEIVARFGPTVEAAARGELDGWAATPRGRLALILVCDQFPRSLYRDSARAYSLDARALALAEEGLANGDFEALTAVWEKMFFTMPLGHSESVDKLRRVVDLAAAIAAEAPPHLRKVYEMSAAQPRGHLEVVERFGRQPHRNAVLGRVSTPEEADYLARGDFVHKRPIPG